jgi:GWxTD domain-containing protein
MTRDRISKLYRLSIIFWILFTRLSAQSNYTPKQFVLNTDYCRFWRDDTTTYLEISTAFSPNFTILSLDSSGLKGKIEMGVDIQDTKSNAVIYRDRFSIPMHFADSVLLLKTKSLVNNRTYSLAKGTYFISLYGYDSNDRTRCDSIKFTVEINDRSDSLMLSDIEFCSNITESKDQKSNFYKNTYLVIPNPSRIFGATTSPLIFTYMEYYHVMPGKVYVIQSQVLDSKGEIKKSKTYRRKFLNSNVVDVSTLNVTTLFSGKYTYEVILSDTLGSALAKAQRIVYLYNPQIQPALETLVAERSSEFAKMTYEELGNEFKSAKYIATSDEVNTFENLTTVEARRNFMAKFWIRVETQEAGRTDLTRASYLQKVILANQRYGVFSKEGWRSARGRVFLLYGEPDEVQRFPYAEDSRPYEIWNYHQIEGGVVFIFVDLTGFNEYTLVHSTKRSEIHDNSWEQFLKRN